MLTKWKALNRCGCTRRSALETSFTALPWVKPYSLFCLKKSKQGCLNDGLPQRTDHTITHRTDLIKHLEGHSGAGFAIDDVENEEGVRCVGAPIFDYTGRAFAALSISGPAYRLSVPRLLELAPLTMKAARAVSAKLGYVPTAEAGYPFKSGC